MRTITKTIDLYTIKELSEKAVKTAHERYLETRSFDLNFDLQAECELEHLIEIAGKLGIAIDDIHYTGFHSQGDGACFIGELRYRDDWLTQIAEYDNEHSAKTYQTLKSIGESLQMVYDKCGGFTATTRDNNSRYSHEYSVAVDVEFDNDIEWTAEPIVDAMREYMRFCYRSLEAIFEYESSLEAFIDAADNNEWEYNEDGILHK